MSHVHLTGMLDSIHTNTLTYRSHPNASRFAGTRDLHSNQCSLMHCQPTMAPARIEADDPGAAAVAAAADAAAVACALLRYDSTQYFAMPNDHGLSRELAHHHQPIACENGIFSRANVLMFSCMCVRLCVRLCTRTHTHTLTICKCLAFCSCARAHKRRACVRVCVWGARTLPFPYMHMCVRACLPTGRKNASQF